MLFTQNQKQALDQLGVQGLRCMSCGGIDRQHARYCPGCGALLSSNRINDIEVTKRDPLRQFALYVLTFIVEQIKQKRAMLKGLHFSWEKMMLVSLGLVFVGLVIGSYTSSTSTLFAWTGFGGSTLRDWLQLLILPLAWGLMPLWFSREKELLHTWLAHRKMVLIAIGIPFVLLFVVLEIGSWKGHWAWTGFKGDDAPSQWDGKLWDWLNLLLLPIIITALPIWFNLRQHKDTYETSNKPHQSVV